MLRACLAPPAIPRQLARGDVELPRHVGGDDLGDGAQVVGAEAQEAERAELQGEPQAVGGRGRARDLGAVGAGEGEVGLDVAGDDLGGEAVEPLAFRVAEEPDGHGDLLRGRSSRGSRKLRPCSGRRSRGVGRPTFAWLERIPGVVVVFPRTTGRSSHGLGCEGGRLRRSGKPGRHASTSMLGSRRSAGCSKSWPIAGGHWPGPSLADPGLVVPEKTDDPRAMSRFIAEVYRNHGPRKARSKPSFNATSSSAPHWPLPICGWWPTSPSGIAIEELPTLTSFKRGSAAFSKRSTVSIWRIRRSCQLTRPGGFARPSSPPWPRGPILSASRRAIFANSPGIRMNTTAKVSQERGRHHVATESIQRIHAATRPAVSLDETRFTSLHTMSNPERDLADDIDLDEAVGKWMVSLRPRERQVLSYRFGLGGRPRLSLSQVGKVLDVSKERVRQIQNAALKMLRTNVSPDNLIQNN